MAHRFSSGDRADVTSARCVWRRDPRALFEDACKDVDHDAALHRHDDFTDDGE